MLLPGDSRYRRFFDSHSVSPMACTYLRGRPDYDGRYRRCLPEFYHGEQAAAAVLIVKRRRECAYGAGLDLGILIDALAARRPSRISAPAARRPRCGLESEAAPRTAKPQDARMR